MKLLHEFKQNPLTEKTEVNESIVDTATVKILPSGRKSRAHRLKLGDVGRVRDSEEVADNSEEEPKKLKENIATEEPPFVLVLKRKAFRYYPNNLKVALYYNDRLKKYFSVPYVDSGNVKSVVQAEDYQESVLDKLHTIVESKESEYIILENGDKVFVDYETATAITKVHSALNEDNQQKMSELLSRGSLDFNKVVSFSLTKTK